MIQLETLRSDELCEGETQMIKPLLYLRLTEDRAVTRLQPHSVYEHNFKMHLNLLDRWGFTTITLKDYHLFRQKKLHLPKKPVIITVDNGSEETYRVALPLLQEAGCKAVIFVPVDSGSRGNGRGHTDTAGKPMSSDQLRQLSAAGMEIGSLSLTRQSLTMISHDEAREEISRSRHQLEMILGEPVVSFAYPLGHVNPVVKSMVQEAGYAFACAWSTGPGTFGDDVLEIRRLSISTGVGAVGLALRLSAPYELYEQAIQRTRTALRWDSHRSAIRI